jgi:hypothetical protein
VTTPPRYAPGLAFPPYAFVAPHWPHPVNDPGGHMRGCAEATPPPLDPRLWRASESYLRGLDLFNHGYYWEAHEAWEGLWHAAGREGTTAEFLKGLIKLAAAGVKVRQGMPRGVRIHGERALEHFTRVRAATGASEFAGFRLDDLDDFAATLVADAERLRGDPAKPVEVVFELVLAPRG